MSALLGPEIGHFYFISPRLADICPDAGLMDLSKGDMRDRPCLCVAITSKLNIFWMVPLSSAGLRKGFPDTEHISRYRGVCEMPLPEFLRKPGHLWASRPAQSYNKGE